MSKDVKLIRFNEDNIRQILKGNKTQTRRVVKPQPPIDPVEGHVEGGIYGPEWFHPEVVGKDGEAMPGEPIFGIYDFWGEWGIKCPYYPRQSLWVQEGWTVADVAMDAPEDEKSKVIIAYKADGIKIEKYVSHELHSKLEDKLEYLQVFGDGGDNWQSPRFMPYEIARLFLEVVDIRVERLQDIDRDDAKKEGVSEYIHEYIPDYRINFKEVKETVENFAELWDNIYSGTDYSWKYNSLVWVIDFVKES